MDNGAPTVKVFFWLKEHSLGEKPCCDNCKYFHPDNFDTCGASGMLCGSWEEADTEQMRLMLDD